MQLKNEYGTEFTWCISDQFRNWHGITQEVLDNAFPLPVPPEPEAPPEPEPTPAEPEVTSEVTEEPTEPEPPPVVHTVYSVALAEFLEQGMQQRAAEAAANKLAAEVATARLGGGLPRNTNAQYDRARKIERIVARVNQMNGNEEISTEEQPVPSSPYTPVMVGSELVNAHLLKAWDLRGMAKEAGRLSVSGGGSEVELHSFAIKTIEDFEWWYKFATTGFANMGFTFYGDGATSGGGHLHVSPPRMNGGTVGTKYNGAAIHWMMHFISAHPYLQWAFNDYNDGRNAPSPIFRLFEVLQSRRGQSDHLFDAWAGHGKGTSLGLRDMRHRSQTLRSRDVAVNYTLEFRLFEMPQTWDDQLRHIQFCEALINKATALAEQHQNNMRKMWDTMPPLPNVTPAGYFSDFHKWQDARKGFIRALASLGLDPAPYMERADINLQRRFQMEHAKVLV